MMKKIKITAACAIQPAATISYFNGGMKLPWSTKQVWQVAGDGYTVLQKAKYCTYSGLAREDFDTVCLCIGLVEYIPLLQCTSCPRGLLPVSRLTTRKHLKNKISKSGPHQHPSISLTSQGILYLQPVVCHYCQIGEMSFTELFQHIFLYSKNLYISQRWHLKWKFQYSDCVGLRK